MDLFERFNSKFGKWYEGLFGGDAGELRPKDILRKITTAMEDNRKEGFDSKVYVPNKYVLELAVSDPEERDYLLSFLDEEELTSVLQRFMAQNHYHARGPLDFTIAEVPVQEHDARREKLRVKVRFEKGEMASESPVERHKDQPKDVFGAPREAALDARDRSLSTSAGPGVPAAGWVPDDPPTVSSFESDDEPGTVPAVAWAALSITSSDGRKSHWSLTKPSATIGRSRNAGNDVVLDGDGMVSKTHARLDREADGRWTVYDLGSTNGIKVNNQRVSGNRVLREGDEIAVGATTLRFQETGHDDAPVVQVRPTPSPARRARLITPDGLDHVLASETLIGRAVTSDIVLDHPSVSTRHARIIAPDASTYYLEDLGSDAGTWLNGVRLPPRQRTLLADTDRLNIGANELRFAAGPG